MMYHGDRPWMLQAAWRVNNDTISHAVVSFPVNAETREVDYSKPSSVSQFDLILDFLSDENCQKIFHHANFDLRMLSAAGIKTVGKIEDTLFASRCCYSLEPSYGLKQLSKKYLEIEDDDQQNLVKEVNRCRNLARRKYPKIKLGEKPEADYWLPSYFDPKNKLAEIYGVRDVIRDIQLWEFYEQGLTELNCWTAYNLEMEFLQIVLKMEERGIRVDYQQCLLEVSRMWKLIAECKREFHREAKLTTEVNLNSPIQLLSVLRNSGLPFLKNTTGDDLEKLIGPHAKEGGPLATEYPILYWLLMCRGYEKGLGNFTNYIKLAINDPHRSIDDLTTWNNSKSVHATVNQGNTRTFRLSYNDPALQCCANPKTSDGFNVVSARGVFGPRPGYVWYCVDFKQLELRIFASRANEPTLLEVFRSGGDPHDATRQRVPFLACKPKDVGRKLAKNTNFSIVNRGGKKVLFTKYGIPLNEGAIIIRQLYTQFPDMEARQKYLYEFALENGCIYNAYERKLNIDPNAAYTAAPAYDIQGSAIDFIKRAIIKADKIIVDSDLDAHIVLQIHDEIIFEIKKEHCFKWLLLDIKNAIEDHDGVFNLPMESEWARTTTYWSEKSSKGLEWLNGSKP